MKEFKRLVSERIQETLNQLTYESDRYLISYKYLGYDEHKNINTSDLYYNMITVMVTTLDKTTGEKVQTCVDLLKMPVPTENGYKIGKGYKQIMSVTDLSAGWFILEPKKYVEDNNDNLDKDTKARLQYNSKLLRRRFYFFSKKGKIMFSADKNGKNAIPVSYLLQALSGKNRDELIVLLGNNKYVTNTFEEEISIRDAVYETARSLNIRIPDGTTTDLFIELRNLFFKEDIYGKNGAGYHRYCKSTLFVKRALNQILGEDLEVLGVDGIGSEVIPRGTELTEELLNQIDADPSIDTLYVLQNGTLYCLKKYPAKEDRLSVDEMLTMINMYTLILSGYGSYDQMYDLTSRVILSYEDRVLDRINVNINALKDDIIRELKSLAVDEEVSKNLMDALLNVKSANVDALVSDLKKESRVLQTTSDTNLLNLLSVNSKIISSYKGDAAKDEIGVQEHERNRNDAIDQPESSQIGKVHYPSILVKTDDYGFQTAPYYKVVNGEPTEEIVYLSAAEEEGEYVAYYEEDFSGDFVKAYLGGSVVDVPKQQVKYKEVAPHQSIGIARSWIPFGEFNNSKRLLMGANHQKQAVYITGAERPYVSTGTFDLLDAKPVTARDVLKDYYDLYKESLGCSEEEFCSLPLKLNSTTILKGERVLHLEILDSAKYDTVKMSNKPPRNRVTNVRYAFMRSSDVKCVYSNEINPKPDNIYRGDDILYSNLNISTEKADVIECTDYGAFPPSSYNLDFALGKNLLVAYKTYEGKTIEDAITIRKSLCHTDLTSISMIDFDYECFSEDDYTESFGVCDGSKVVDDYILSNGLPKTGTYLSPGDILMCKVRTYTETGEENQLMKRLDAATSGEVISAEIDDEGKVATVILAKYNPIETGDKMSGRYGNKGVVAKVVPDEEMPYIEETGEIIDVILNPLGIPSRMNLGQALEIILGRAAQKEGKCCIVSPFNKDTLPFVKSMREKHKIYPQVLIDGRTGERFERPVEVGIEYMLTLHQKVKSKSKSVAITSSVDQSNGQPQDSTGAQAIGEMETWALEVAGCSKLLQDLFTFQSDDFHSTLNLKQQIDCFPSEITSLNGVNRNNIILQSILMCMGILLKNNEDGDYVREILRDEDVKSLASYALNTATKNSLTDYNIFGDSSKQVYKRNDKFGYIELGCKIVNPYLVGVIKLFEAIPVRHVRYANGEQKNEIKTLHKFLKEDIVDGLAYVSLDMDAETGLPIVFDSNRGEGSCISGISALVYMLEHITIDQVLNFYDTKRRMINDNPESLNQSYECLRSWKEDGYDFKDFVISTYPVLPVAFRNGVPAKRQIHDIDSLYQSVFSTIEKCKKNKTQYTVDSVYRAIATLIGVTNKTDKIPLLASYFGKGKDKGKKRKGKFREQVLKKRVNFSGRSVIIPEDYKMPVTQIGVPISMAFTIWKLHLISILRHEKLLDEYIPVTNQPNDIWYDTLLTYLQTKNFYRFRDKLQEFSDVKLSMEETKVIFQRVKDVLVSFLEEQKVIAGRQPTLHQYGIRAYNVKIVESRAIGINTLSCSGYNADFDGDTMYIVAILDKDTQEDTMERLTMKQSIVNPKDGESVIKLTQDMLLGIYVATMLHNNVASIEEDDRYKTIHHLPDVESLKLMVDLNDISIHDLVTVYVNDRPYLSTAGRILFNEIMPDGFTDKPFSNPLRIPGINEEDGFCDLKYDGLISKKGSKSSSLPVYKSVSKITMDLYEDYDIDTTFDVYQKMMEFGFVNSDKSGVTLGVTDFYSDLYNNTPGTVGEMKDTSVEKYKNIYREKELQINKAIAEGYISSEARSELLQGLGAALNQKVQKDANENLPRNNNLFIISDSGARGNAGQIGQSIGMAGTKMKTLTSSFDIPVMHSYSEGLNTYEMLMDTYASRQGVASTQLNTADAGFALRQMIYMTNAIQVSEDDCGAEPMKFKVEYDGLMRIRKYNYSSKPGDFICDDYDFVGDLVEEFTEDFDVIIEREILGKLVQTRTEHDFNYMQNFITNQREFTQKTIDMVMKKHVHYVCCDDYVYKFDYNLTKFFKSYMLNRFIVSDDEELLKTTINDEHPNPEQVGGYVTDATIKYVEDQNLNHIFMRTTLNCECENYCCKKCYGLAYATKELPKEGEMVGIESAQSIGEPVTQLTMSLFHKGGVAGGSVTNGVTLNNSLLNGTLPTGDLMAKHAVMSSFAKVNTMGKVAIVNLDDGLGNSIRCSVDELNIVDGEYIDQFDTLTEGFTDFNTLGLSDLKGSVSERLKSCYIYETKDKAYAVIRNKNKGNPLFDIGADLSPEILEGENDNIVIETNDFKQRQQMELLKLYNWNFSKEDIDVLPRHFELLVKVQTQTIRVINSNLSGIKVNDLHSYIELKRKAIEEDGYFIYPLAVAKQHEVVMLNSGPISSLVFIDIDKNLRALMANRQLIEERGFVGKMTLGENLYKPGRKVLQNFTVYDKKTERLNVTEEKAQVNQDLSAFSIVNVVDEDGEKVDEMDLFGTDLFDFEEEDDIFDTPTEQSPKPEIEIKETRTMNLFNE